MSSFRKHYTLEEDKRILECIIRNDGFYKLRGFDFWKTLVRDEFPHRTFQSLHSRFRKNIIKNIDNPAYGLSEEMVQKIQNSYKETAKKNSHRNDYTSHSNKSRTRTNGSALAEDFLEIDSDSDDSNPQSNQSGSIGRNTEDLEPRVVVESEEPSPQSKVFMISVKKPELKARLISSLEELGGQVSDTNSYDPRCTHLLCYLPVENRKIHSCIAAGKWILDIEYVNACMKARKFLNEEEYEFGNPKFIGISMIEIDRELELKMQAIYDWRNEIARTGRGAFHAMRAIIIMANSNKKEALACIIQAGGGTVVEATPPFDDVPIDNLTHCLMEAESVSNFSLYEPLAKQGIYCATTEFVHNTLYRTNMDIKDSILPFYQKYFR